MVYQRLQALHLKVAQKKCHFTRTSIKFLGQNVIKDELCHGKWGIGGIPSQSNIAWSSIKSTIPKKNCLSIAKSLSTQTLGLKTIE